LWEQVLTDWTNVEFGKVRRPRRAHDLLPVLDEMLAVWDFGVCALSAEAARFWLGRAIPMQGLISPCAA
jgi:hypothetical protein